jgi:hypothetical protein
MGQPQRATSFPFDWSAFDPDNADDFGGAPDEPHLKVADRYPEIPRLRGLFPELDGWGDYERTVWAGASQTVPERHEERPVEFLGFLYHRQANRRNAWPTACFNDGPAREAYEGLRRLYPPEGPEPKTP